MRSKIAYFNKPISWKEYLHATMIFLFWGFVITALALGVDRIISFYIRLPDLSFVVMYIFVLPLAFYISKVFDDRRELKDLILDFEQTLKIHEQLETKYGPSCSHNIFSMKARIETLIYEEKLSKKKKYRDKDY